jgi:hypothetical protein
MEHQTMTSLGFFDYYINAHELGHQWWGDNVTCKSWGDIWINEGFASYTEHLVAEYLDPTNFAANLQAAHASVMGQTGGSIYFTGSDTLNTPRIFSSRLTYDKGGAIIHSLRFLTNNDSVWFNTLRGFQNTYKNSTASAIDFQNYYQAQTSINPSIFFNQWYYGEGYPTFSVNYNFRNNNFLLRSTQSVSKFSVTPLFITPLEYRISRAGKVDTVIRVMHSTAVENYTIPLTGTVTGVVCDPANWIINKSNVSRDTMMGYVAPPPVDPNPVSITEYTDYSGLTCGPVPAHDEIYIGNAANLNGTIRIYDLAGKLVQAKPLAGNTTVPLDNVRSGQYLLKIEDGFGQTVYEQKILKK